MYSFPELNKIIRRCVTMSELEQACEGLKMIIEDGDLSDDKRNYVSLQTQIKFRQLTA